MTKNESSYGFKRLTARSADHAIILLHGIRQTRDDVERPFGSTLAEYAKSADVYVYGYNHTLALLANSSILCELITQQITAKRIDIVGYSMGGLVARLAATERENAAMLQSGN